ncbi:Ca-activated chloride channel family protein [Sulfitobacter marinus]|uniref:Ca-activated chloride channel family protein n=1 Tax=Sulfitobacter marinus TaxID=394264 RepID=A0A1I6SVV7_9RHOB|nr:VWA domain-containing protein [Sulfitobacter marinus]SFS81104.1 Ca-activated chloride channel family protein [Sulfitobacter marinus]
MSGIDIILLRPWWLLGLPVLALVGWWLLTRRGGLGDWQKASDPALLRAMAALGRIDTSSSRVPVLAMLAVVAIALLALSGPAIERRDTVSFRNLDGVLFVIDTSASVTDDVRWPQMQAMARFGSASLGTRPGGLIVYAGDAYAAVDMTLDHLQLGQTLSLLDAKTVPDVGTRPERALMLARDLLREAQVIAGDVILFTDGDGLGAASLRQAATIAGQGARLSVVSLNAPSAAIDTHAAAGAGRVFTLDQSDVFAAWINETARTRLEAQDYPLIFWKDMGRYLLLLALFPLLLLFRRQIA